MKVKFIWEVFVVPNRRRRLALPVSFRVWGGGGGGEWNLQWSTSVFHSDSLYPRQHGRRFRGRPLRVPVRPDVSAWPEGDCCCDPNHSTQPPTRRYHAVWNGPAVSGAPRRERFRIWISNITWHVFPSSEIYPDILCRVRALTTEMCYLLIWCELKQRSCERSCGQRQMSPNSM